MQNIKLVNLTNEFKHLIEIINKQCEHQYIRKKLFTPDFFLKGVYLWIYQKENVQRIIYVGTAIGMDGFYKRNKDHINNILKGDETFYSLPEFKKDIYELFVYDYKNKNSEKHLKEISIKKNIWIPKGEGEKKHSKTNEEFDSTWKDLAYDFLYHCSLIGLTFDNGEKYNDLLKEEAKKIESYLQFKIIDFFKKYTNESSLEFIQYYDNYDRHSFWGKIEKEWKEIPTVIKETDFLEKYLFPIVINP